VDANLDNLSFVSNKNFKSIISAKLGKQLFFGYSPISSENYYILLYVFCEGYLVPLKINSM